MDEKSKYWELCLGDQLMSTRDLNPKLSTWFAGGRGEKLRWRWRRRASSIAIWRQSDVDELCLDEIATVSFLDLWRGHELVLAMGSGESFYGELDGDDGNMRISLRFCWNQLQLWRWRRRWWRWRRDKLRIYKQSNY